MPPPVSKDSITSYEIRDHVGALQAIHERHDLPDGKRMAWRLPGRTAYGLEGRRTDSLPLYGAQHVANWSRDMWLVITEGERDADALTRLDVPALGTVTGAAAAPTPESLAGVAVGRRFVTWPDNDDAGRQHMALVAANLYRAGAVDIRNVIYRPVIVNWPKNAGARDLVGNADPNMGALVVAWLVEEWSLPVGRPGSMVASEKRPSRLMGDTGSVSDALIACGVSNAKPGRTVRCPAHPDRHASLSILRDDRRAICKSASCLWSGRGVIAADVRALVSA
jgi:hypothetical protein